MQPTILRAQEEMQRLEAELKRTQREKEILEKRFDTVEYAKNVCQRVLGEKLGRFVGGVWGYAARFGFGTADLLAEFTGGKKFGERKQEVMEWIGHAVETGNEERGLIGAASRFVLSSARAWSQPFPTSRIPRMTERRKRSIVYPLSLSLAHCSLTRIDIFPLY